MSDARLYARDIAAIESVQRKLDKLTEFTSDDYYVQAHTEEGVRLWHGDGYSPGVFVLEDEEWFFRASYKEAGAMADPTTEADKQNREFVERIARATLDWWDFDGSYREANHFDGEIDVDAILAEAAS